MSAQKAVAIVGIATDLPSGPSAPQNYDHESFYEFLMKKGEAYELMPKERFDVENWRGNGIGYINIGHGTFLKDIDLFDNVEFGISSRDAKFMEPVTRKLVELCFLALLDSGIDYRNRNVGCYTSGNVGPEWDDYDIKGAFSGFPSMVANRVSNHLDLLGPSFPTDTACSSTITALHLAVQAVLNGDCEAAVVGGCQLNHRIHDWVAYSQTGLLAKDGKCKPFDASADGFGRAEGCAACVVKPLEDAIRDHDTIYATILGTAINSTGGAAAPGAPVAEAQQIAMLQAFKRAGRSPRDVDFMELHATGTATGDPTESNWVGAQMCREDELLLGSVKGNIGHTEIVALMASLSKVISIFKHKMIPPNANFTTPNPAIGWDKYNLRVPVIPEPLTCRNGDKSLIGITSSGIGGSNGHVVLESPPVLASLVDDAPESHDLVLLMAAGLSPRTSKEAGEHIKANMVGDASKLPALSTAMGRRARQMIWRSFAIAGPSAASVSFSQPQFCQRKARPVVFVFSGQGPQHADMGRELYRKFPVFRDSINEMDVVYKAVTGKSLLEDYGLFVGEKAKQLPEPWPISLILPSIAVFQLALYDLITSLGLKPDVIVGHSAGETALLYASGAASKAMVVEMAILRGEVFTLVEPHGGSMAALSCSAEEAIDILNETAAEREICEIACYNSHSAVAIAGHITAIDRAISLAKARGIFGRRIQTRVPVHSSMMEHCRDAYNVKMAELFAKYPGSHRPKIPVVSTKTGEYFDGEFDAEYYWGNTRNTVLFTQALDLLAQTESTFIEIAPHPVLSAYISSLAPEPNVVLQTVRRARPGKPMTEHFDMLTLFGKYTAAGHNNLDFAKLNSRAGYEYTEKLPAYPFQKKHISLYPGSRSTSKRNATRHGPINHKHLKMNKDTHPTLAQHVIREVPILPAAAYIEMAVEFGASSLLNVNLRSMLSLASENPDKIDVSLDGSYWAIKSIIAAPDGSKRERLHGDGYLSFEEPPAYAPIDLQAVRTRCTTKVSAEFYKTLSFFSTYGPVFQRASNIKYGKHEVLAHIQGMDAGLAKEGHYILHPAILDACLHMTCHKPFHGDLNPNSYYLPAHVGTVVLHQERKAGYFPSEFYAYAKLNWWQPDRQSYDFVLVDEAGNRILTMEGFEAARHYINPLSDAYRPFDVVMQPVEQVTIEGFKIWHQNSLASDAEASAAQAVAASIDELRDTIRAHYAKSRVVRILITSNDEAILARVNTLIKEFPTHFFDVTIGKETQSEALEIEPRAGMLRNKPVNLVEAAEKAHANHYDIILAFDSVTEEIPLDKVAQGSRSLLAPGGTFIATEKAAGSAPEASLDGSAYTTVTRTSSAAAKTALAAPLKTVQDANFAISNARYIEAAQQSYYTVVSSVRPEEVNGAAIFDASKDKVFKYTLGCEMELQAEFNKLGVTDELNIWVLAEDGLDAGSAQGFMRALRREYLSWTLRLVVFPASYSDAKRVEVLAQIPSSIKDEPDVFVTKEGKLVVPRMLPFPKLDAAEVAANAPSKVNPDQTLVELGSVAAFGAFTSFSGTVASSDFAGLGKGVQVFGITSEALEGKTTGIEPTNVAVVSSRLAEQVKTVAPAVPGFVAAILAPGYSTFFNLASFKKLRVLVTHADNAVGAHIKYIYEKKGLNVVTVPEDIGLLRLARLGRESFDLVVSGYEDIPHRQIIDSLLAPEQGRTFYWNNKNTGIVGVMGREPCAFAEAVRCAVGLAEEHLDAIASLPKVAVVVAGSVAKAVPEKVSPIPTFDSEKVYVLLGGIGSLGAHSALMMYERGARHIILTSRSGASKIDSSRDVGMRRILNYLKEREDLDIRYEAVDATSAGAMKALLDTVKPRQIGGVVILTAAANDAVFQRLKKSDFTAMYDSKLGVLRALEAATDVSKVDMVVAFSSISGLLGLAGQTNYGGANTVLEEAVAAMPNGFSFVCPGILNSSMMLSDEGQQDDRLEGIIEWSISAEDMVMWLEDAVYRFQHGEGFKRYIPDLDWDAVERTIGVTKIGKHLLTTKTAAVGGESNVAETIAAIVRKVLDIPADELSPELPLSNYGVDSLSASRLSYALRPIVEVSQIQLLANTSLQDIQKKAAAASA